MLVPVIVTDHRTSIAGTAIRRLGYAARAVLRQSPAYPIPLSYTHRDRVKVDPIPFG